MKFLIEEGAGIPEYGSELASGLDVTAFKILKVFRGDREIEPENLKKVQEGFEKRGYIKLRSLERILFGTGIRAVLPENLELQVRSRSGITLKRGLCVLNSPGTIDADYQGEIGVIMYKNLFRADTVIIKRALKQYAKNNLIKSDEQDKIDRVIKELDKPESDAVIYAEFADFMLKRLLEQYTIIDKNGNKINSDKITKI